MSVIMGLVLEVDPARFEEVVANNGDRMVEIASRGKEAGAIHHRFYANEDGSQVLVVDEWPGADEFNKFFASSQDIGELLAQAGIRSEPHPVFWRELDTPDKF
jgi:hypothetical protein